MLLKFIARTLKIQLIAWGFAIFFVFTIRFLGEGFLLTFLLPGIHLLNLWQSLCGVTLIAVIIVVFKYGFRLMQREAKKLGENTTLAEVMLHISILVGILGLVVGLGCLG